MSEHAKSCDKVQQRLQRSLREISRHLNGFDQEDPWVQDIQRRVGNIEAKGQTTSAKIAFAGVTGVGKSRCINAMLGKDLLPTSDSAACTAVPIEIKWNPENKPYIADIEFMSIDEYREEIKILLDDVNDANGYIDWERLESRHRHTNDDYIDIAGKAIARIRALFPDVVKQRPEKFSVEDMMSDDIMGYLGKTIRVEPQDKASFLTTIQRYLVDCSEGDSDTKNLWPLIKCVQILDKAPILQAGVTLVDLPGVSDNNAIRRSIAEKHIGECSSILVLSPAIRAKNEKIASDLMQQEIGKQLELNGDLQNIAFVCTKTDDICTKVDRFSLLRQPSPEALLREIQPLLDRRDELYQQRRTQDGRPGRSQRDRLKIEIDRVCARIKYVRIRHRNEYLTTAIRRDFITEIATRGGATITEGELPVFCVSADAYSLMTEECREEAQAKGFMNIIDTGIPALQEHCLHIANELRTKRLKTFINDYSRLIDYLGREIRHDLGMIGGSQARYRARIQVLQSTLNTLDGTLKKIAETLSSKLQDCLSSNILNPLTEATAQANPGWRPLLQISTNKNWTSMHHQTLGATIRRQGQFTNNRDDFDFNRDLSDLVLKVTDVSWHSFFEREVPCLFMIANIAFKKQMDEFTAVFLRLLAGCVMNETTVKLMKVQLLRCRRSIDDRLEEAEKAILVQKRIRNRFMIAIRKEMKSGYLQARRHSGDGMKKRMLRDLRAHIKEQSPGMFIKAGKILRTAVHDECVNAVGTLQNEIKDVIVDLLRDVESLSPKDRKPNPEFSSEFRGTVMKAKNMLEKVEAELNSFPTVRMKQIQADAYNAAYEDMDNEDSENGTNAESDLEINASSLHNGSDENDNVLIISTTRGPSPKAEPESDSDAGL